VSRCVSEHPGDLIHLDIKTLGRLDSVNYRFSGYRKGRSKSEGVGWEYVNVGIEDAPRISFTISPRPKGNKFHRFSETAVAYCNSLRVIDIRVMANNGSCYEACTLHDTCKQLGLKYIRSLLVAPKDQWQSWRLHQNHRHRIHPCQSLHLLGPTLSSAPNLAQSVN